MLLLCAGRLHKALRGRAVHVQSSRQQRGHAEEVEDIELTTGCGGPCHSTRGRAQELGAGKGVVGGAGRGSRHGAAWSSAEGRKLHGCGSRRFNESGDVCAAARESRPGSPFALRMRIRGPPLLDRGGDPRTATEALEGGGGQQTHDVGRRDCVFPATTPHTAPSSGKSLAALLSFYSPSVPSRC